MPWIKLLKKPQWRMCQLTNFGASNEEKELKIESMWKTEQDRPCQKFWLLVKGQRKKSKSKSTGPRSKSTDTGPGRVTGRAVDSLTSSYDVSLTWTRADVDMLAWLLTWSDDVIIWRLMTSTAITARGRSMRVHQHVEEKSETQVAHEGTCNSGWPPDSQAK